MAGGMQRGRAAGPLAKQCCTTTHSLRLTLLLISAFSLRRRICHRRHLTRTLGWMVETNRPKLYSAVLAINFYALPAGLCAMDWRIGCREQSSQLHSWRRL